MSAGDAIQRDEEEGDWGGEWAEESATMETKETDGWQMAGPGSPTLPPATTKEALVREWTRRMRQRIKGSMSLLPCGNRRTLATAVQQLVYGALDLASLGALFWLSRTTRASVVSWLRGTRRLALGGTPVAQLAHGLAAARDHCEALRSLHIDILPLTTPDDLRHLQAGVLRLLESCSATLEEVRPDGVPALWGQAVTSALLSRCSRLVRWTPSGLGTPDLAAMDALLATRPRPPLEAIAFTYGATKFEDSLSRRASQATQTRAVGRLIEAVCEPRWPALRCLRLEPNCWSAGQLATLIARLPALTELDLTLDQHLHVATTQRLLRSLCALRALCLRHVVDDRKRTSHSEPQLPTLSATDPLRMLGPAVASALEELHLQLLDPDSLVQLTFPRLRRFCARSELPAGVVPTLAQMPALETCVFYGGCHCCPDLPCLRSTRAAPPPPASGPHRLAVALHGLRVSDGEVMQLCRDASALGVALSCSVLDCPPVTEKLLRMLVEATIAQRPLTALAELRLMTRAWNGWCHAIPAWVLYALLDPRRLPALTLLELPSESVQLGALEAAPLHLVSRLPIVRFANDED